MRSEDAIRPHKTRKHRISGYPAAGQLLRAEMVLALDRYVEHGIVPGSFLLAALSNDFLDTAQKADEDNVKSLAALASFLYWEMPPGSYGSPAIVKKWVDRFGQQKESA